MGLGLNVLDTQTKVTVGAETLAEHHWVTALLRPSEWQQTLVNLVLATAFLRLHHLVFGQNKHFNSLMQISVQFLKNKKISYPSFLSPTVWVCWGQGGRFVYVVLSPKSSSTSPEKCALKPYLHLRMVQAVMLAFCWDLQNWTKKNASANEVGFQASESWFESFFKKGTACMTLKTSVRVYFHKPLYRRFWNK